MVLFLNLRQVGVNLVNNSFACQIVKKKKKLDRQHAKFNHPNRHELTPGPSLVRVLGVPPVGLEGIRSVF